MNVRLIGSTDKPEIVCAYAASVCTQNEPQELNYSKACELIERVIGYGHLSIAEHAAFSFEIDGVSRALSHQLVRHRLASYSQRSQRYIKESTDSFGYHPDYQDQCVWPESIMQASEDIKHKYFHALKVCHQEYAALIAAGIPKEDARFVLPNAQKTTIVMTMNARAWREFLAKRLCKKAQWEIRTMAEEIYKQLKMKSPALFKGVGPDCKNCKERTPCK